IPNHSHTLITCRSHQTLRSQNQAKDTLRVTLPGSNLSASPSIPPLDLSIHTHRGQCRWIITSIPSGEFKLDNRIIMSILNLLPDRKSSCGIIDDDLAIDSTR